MVKLAVASWGLTVVTVEAMYGSRSKAHVTIAGQKRDYQYHVPSKCSGKSCPMLLSYHGQGGSIAKPGFDQSADSYGYIMVYLQGIGEGSCGTGWNTVLPGQDISNTCVSSAASCCYQSCLTENACTKRNNGCRWATCADDVAFTKAVISAMGSVVKCGDIFAQGFSNGGMMMHALMTAMPTTFKAIVPTFGLPMPGTWDVGSPIGVPYSLKGTSVLYMHGRSDSVIPVKGGLADGWYYVSESDAMKALASVNGCGSKASTWKTPYDGTRSHVACVQHSCSGVTIGECLYDGEHGAWPSNGDDLMFWFLTNYGAASQKAVNVDLGNATGLAQETTLV